MPATPKLGQFYTREQIHAMYGGGKDAFLPTKNGRVVCGCFRLDTNPEAPAEIRVGVGPIRETSARTAVLQQTPFPIFLKREEGEWEYIGNYRATRYLHRGHKFLAEDERAKSEALAGILYMEPVAPGA